MPGTKLKALYVGKCIADLKDLFNITDTIRGKKISMLCKTAEKLYDQAAQQTQAGDEEQGYIHYMKYLTIVTLVQKSEEYKKDANYFKYLLGPQKMKLAIHMAEKLSKSLDKRYQLLNEQENLEAAQLAQEEREAKEELRKQIQLEMPPESTSLVNGLPDSSEVSISSEHLYSLLEKKINILILDSRQVSCYNKSHMNIGNCINVPENIVKPGISAAGLEKDLPTESKAAWTKRKDADLVVLLDWSTTEKSHKPGTNLYILKSILNKWDPGIIYRHPPVILEGGYEDWVSRYPMYTTNPKVEVPRQNNVLNLDELLDDVEYPNSLIDIPTLVPQPKVDRSSKPLVSGKGSLSADSLSLKRATMSQNINGGHPRISSSSSDKTNNASKPGIDRSAKAAALQTYEERSRVSMELLDAKERLANKSSELEESKMNLVQESEILRITKEKEAEEERVQCLQNREEELLCSIYKMEEKQRIQEAENQSLKEKLELYEERVTKQINHVNKIKSHKEDAVIKEEEGSKPTNKAKERNSAEERQRIKDAEKAKKLEGEERKEKEEEKQEKGIYYTQLKSDVPSSTSKMKRSHSTPNIAQMTDELDDLVKHKTPQFDRANKPLQKPQPKQRNFSPVYGNVERGLTGLKNLGNSCYMNSIIQCINNTTPLVTYFCERHYCADINSQNSNTKGQVAEEIAYVIRALWNDQYRSIACRDFKAVVGWYRKQFQGYEQQDSHEFFTILMDWLHEDLNKQSSKSPLKEISNNMSAADQAWEKFRRCNESFIRTLFYGQQKSTVRCCKCNEESVTYEPFSDLSLPLPSSSNKCSLNECMKLYLNGEKITGWNCPSCKEKRDAIKKFDIWRLPPILVIHLNRFHHDGWWCKRQTYVDFPISLDMSRFTPGPEQRYVNYNLYSVSNHYGTMEGGHYTAYCKNYLSKKWHKFDDNEVSEISENEVRSGAAYILFYASSEYKVPDNTSSRSFR